MAEILDGRSGLVAAACQMFVLLAMFVMFLVLMVVIVIMVLYNYHACLADSHEDDP